MQSKTYGDKQREAQQRKKQEELRARAIAKDSGAAESPKPESTGTDKPTDKKASPRSAKRRPA